MQRVVEVIDITVLVGHRTQADQDEAYNTKRSQLQWPDSKHNQLPSKAIDISPYPIPKDWDPKGFIYVAGVVKAEAHHMGLRVRWGGDWDEDDDLTDNRFNDYVHFELVA
jgi:peptidoglycan L-alanyl-D-glutamate endopeptidase CwlK